MKKLLLGLSMLFLSSCMILAPIISSFKETGATQSDREMLFQKAIKEFHTLEATRNPEQAAVFAKSENKMAMANTFRERSLSERIVESTIGLLEYQDEARKAFVTVNKKYFRVPQYMVKERREKETWEFISSLEGWRIASIELISTR
jgi:hypothetical protein